MVYYIPIYFRYIEELSEILRKSHIVNDDHSDYSAIKEVNRCCLLTIICNLRFSFITVIINAN